MLPHRRMLPPHGEPPYLKTSGRRNYGSPKITSPLSTSSVKLGRADECATRPVCPSDAAARATTVWSPLWVNLGKAQIEHFTAGLPQTVCPSLKRRLTLDVTARVTDVACRLYGTGQR